MIIFNQEIYKDIRKLKRLSKLKDREKYSEFKRALCKKYNTVPRTIERWMNKRIPGQRKTRADAGKQKVKVTRKQKSIAVELLSKGEKIKTIRKTIQNKTGKKISKEKLDTVREKMSDAVINETEEQKKTNFGDKAKAFFEKLFDLDLIAPDHGIKMKVENKYFIIQKGDIEDICLILANAYNRNEFASKNKYTLDRQALREKMILHLIEMQIRCASESSSTKDIEALTRMHDRMKETFEMNANIKTLEAICKELQPDISFDDIISLIKKHSHE